MNVNAFEASTGTQSATQSFTVNVILNTDCPQYLDFQTAVELGGVALLTNCPTLVVTNVVVITNDVTIMAETNVIIAGNNLTRLFTVRSGGSLTLSNLTLLSGRSGIGGAILIEKGGTVTCMGCTFRGTHRRGGQWCLGHPRRCQRSKLREARGPWPHRLAGRGWSHLQRRQARCVELPVH